jgi:NAD(P)-dependent dehydrogenase (short-subunit alcohol dehydrogenase family)
MSPLSGKVAVVTGASRGIGKGIALALADEGATAYVTGRTVTPGSYPFPGTVGETAAEVDHRGGKGIAIQVDHANGRSAPEGLSATAAERRSHADQGAGRPRPAADGYACILLSLPATDLVRHTVIEFKPGFEPEQRWTYS